MMYRKKQQAICAGTHNIGNQRHKNDEMALYLACYESLNTPRLKPLLSLLLGFICHEAKTDFIFVPMNQPPSRLLLLQVVRGGIIGSVTG